MKKILLIASIFSFGFAAAQEPYVIDADKFLQNHKQVSPFKQDANPDLQTLLKDYYSRMKSVAQPKFYTLPNGNRVYTLPQDNMPCIVSYSGNYNMPNPAPHDLPRVMPNPAIPFRLTPPVNK